MAVTVLVVVICMWMVMMRMRIRIIWLDGNDLRYDLASLQAQTHPIK